MLPTVERACADERSQKRAAGGDGNPREIAEEQRRRDEADERARRPPHASSTTQAIARGGRADGGGVSVSRPAIAQARWNSPAAAARRGALANFADDVGRLVLRLVIGPRLQLGEQAEREQLHAGEHQQDAEAAAAAGCRSTSPSNSFTKAEIRQDERAGTPIAEADQTEDLHAAASSS